MRAIELDASAWRSVVDFYEALLAALGAPYWHGRSMGALIDSMIWGDINEVEPPYTVKIANIDPRYPAIAAEIDDLRKEILEQRRYRLENYGHDVEVSIDISERA